MALWWIADSIVLLNIQYTPQHSYCKKHNGDVKPHDSKDIFLVFALFGVEWLDYYGTVTGRQPKKGGTDSELKEGRRFK